MEQLIVSGIFIFFIVFCVALGATPLLILLERKTASWVQDRIGPNRVGFAFGLNWERIGLGFMSRWSFGGLGQSFADGLKFLTKEDYTPASVDKFLFMLAPFLAFFMAMIGWAVIPWGGLIEWNGQILNTAVAPVNVGVIYILAVGSMAVYGVVLAGYASNNKYSFFGGLRATAQMLSYEIPMGLTVLIIVLMAGTVRPEMIIWQQASEGWNILYQPILFIVFMTCILAETNRAPFDLAEAESELVGGYHTEYSSMKFALFFLGEYVHMLTGSAFLVLLFLGGWDIPFIQEPWIAEGSLFSVFALVALKVHVFLIKVLAVMFFMMWLRWTLPRFRFDQLMQFAWRDLIPLTLALLLLTSFVIMQPREERLFSLLLINGALAVGGPALWRLIMPKGPDVNRRVKLEGSRFSAPDTPHHV